MNCTSLLNPDWPGASDTFVVLFGIDSQYADPRANVDQKQRVRVLQIIGFLFAVLRVCGIFIVVTLRRPTWDYRVDVKDTLNQTVQLVQL